MKIYAHCGDFSDLTKAKNHANTVNNQLIRGKTSSKIGVAFVRRRQTSINKDIIKYEVVIEYEDN